METYGLFNPSQHGFWFWRSCIRRPHRTAELLANGGNVEILYMNFAKEFGKIGFYITLKKLNSIGVTGKVERLVYSFLTQRTQVFIVNSSGSRLPEVKSQGSVLGPLLFLILLGDIDQGTVKAFLSIFADDTRIGNQIMSVEDGENLQTDLDTLYSWTTQNNMKLNEERFECLCCGPKHTLQDTIQYRANTGSIVQAKCSGVRDIWITMGNKRSFKEHIQSAIIEAKKQCSWILRTFNTSVATAMLT